MNQFCYYYSTAVGGYWVTFASNSAAGEVIQNKKEDSDG